MLVMQDVLGEKLVIGNHENVIGYAVLGCKAMHLLNGRYKVIIGLVGIIQSKRVTILCDLELVQWFSYI